MDYHTWFTKVHEHHQKTRQAVSLSEDSSPELSDNLKMPKARLDIRKNFFSNRVIGSWNNLPLSVKTVESTNDFKVSFDKHFYGK